MRWSDLQYCHIERAWVPENELLSFTEHHPLVRLTLRQVTLTSGSWKSFFSQVRELKPRPHIVCEGILPSQRLLHYFLTHAEFPWPFLDTEDDIPMFSLSP